MKLGVIGAFLLGSLYVLDHRETYDRVMLIGCSVIITSCIRLYLLIELSKGGANADYTCEMAPNLIS
jgi:hypothetical protein